MNLHNLNKEIEVQAALINNSPVEDFEGLTPIEMDYLLYAPFSQFSPMQFREKIDLSVLAEIPFLNLAIAFLKILEEQESFKLTPKGNLPRKIVELLYDKKIIPNPFIEKGYSTLQGEDDYLPAHTIKIVSQLAGLVKKRDNRLSLTKKANKLLQSTDHETILKLFLTSYCEKFNWAHNDMAYDARAGQLGFGFSLMLLSKYGNVERPVSFYADKYYKAFPVFVELGDEEIEASSLHQEMLLNAYSIRVFSHFAEWFGFADTRYEGHEIFGDKFVTATGVLDKVISFD